MCRRDLPFRLRCVVVLRTNEKKILKNASQLARLEKEKMVAQLSQLEGDTSTSEEISDIDVLGNQFACESQSIPENQSTHGAQSTTHETQSSNLELESKTLVESSNSLEDQSLSENANNSNRSSSPEIIVVDGQLSNLDLNSV